MNKAKDHDIDVSRMCMLVGSMYDFSVQPFLLRQIARVVGGWRLSAPRRQLARIVGREATPCAMIIIVTKNWPRHRPNCSGAMRLQRTLWGDIQAQC